MSDTKARINSFAIRCFRDTGDDDYIAARLAYRAHLVRPFLWSALQCLEKYLKCVLVLNGITTHKLGHDIQSAFKRINDEAPFKIKLNKPEQEIFDHIANYGPDRYLVYSYHVRDKELLKLDMLVWHLRQYCRPLVCEIRLENGEIRGMLQPHLNSIEKNWARPVQQGHLVTGKLEKILAKKSHPSRPALVWKNLRYSTSRRKHIRFGSYMFAENAPLSLDPDLLDLIRPLVELTKEDIRLYTEHWQEEKKGRT